MAPEPPPPIPAPHGKRFFSLSARLPPWAHRARQLVPPVLAGLLSFICVVVHALNGLTGE